MLRREPVDAGTQHRAFVLLLRDHFRRVGLVLDGLRRFLVQRRLAALAQFGQRLEAGNRHQPGRDRGAPLERRRLPPGIEEGVGDDVLGDILAPHQAQRETEDAHLMAREQCLHGELVALGDALDQDEILIRRQKPSLHHRPRPPLVPRRVKPQARQPQGQAAARRSPPAGRALVLWKRGITFDALPENIGDPECEA